MRIVQLAPRRMTKMRETIVAEEETVVQVQAELTEVSAHEVLDHEQEETMSGFLLVGLEMEVRDETAEVTIALKLN
jgi:hypothetical protein